MVRWLAAALVAFTFSIVIFTSDANAQDEVQPLYSLGYGVANNEWRVVTFYSDDTWRFDPIPRRVVFGNRDNFSIYPRWSDDGTGLYMTVFEQNEVNLAPYLFRYDVITRQFEEVTALFDPQDPTISFEFTGVESVSPDQRYAWTFQTTNLQNKLVDLSSGDILYEDASCFSEVLAWRTEDVIASCQQVFFSEPRIFSVNLLAPTDAQLLPAPAPPQQSTFTNFIDQGQLLSDGRLLVGAVDATETEIGVLNPNAYEGRYFGNGQYLQVSPDDTSVSYFRDNRLYRLDLNSLDIWDLGQAFAMSAQNSRVWQDDVLTFWYTREQDGLYEVVRVIAEPRQRIERVLYSGAAPSNILFAPQGDTFALEFREQFDQSYVEVYRDGDLLWVSDFEYPNSYVTFLPMQESEVAWQNEWLHLDYAPEVGTVRQTLSVNTQTGESQPAPEPRAFYGGQSPDGRWWLYSVVTGDETDTPMRLLAFRPADGVVEVLSDNAALHSETFSAYSEWRFLNWSPPIDQP